MSIPSSQLKTERIGAAVVLTISDPATRNTLSPQVYSAGIEALATAESDASVRCVVITGEGSQFCAGGNTQRLADTRRTDPLAQGETLSLYHDFVDAIRAFPKPVIAAVEGYAAGGGFSLALACDLIVAAGSARFVMSYGRIGLTPDGGGSWHLGRQLPRALALQLLWLAEPVEAQRLYALGLVNEVCRDGEALAAALKLADRLAALAPNAVAGAKELVDAAGEQALHRQLEAERRHFLEKLVHANAGEGLQAFFEKRPARFT